MATGDSW